MMSLFESTFVALSLVALSLTLLNALTIWTPRTGDARQDGREDGASKNPSDHESSVEVSILIPMRNEERNVEALIASIDRALANERNRLRWEVIALDDQSVDATRTLLEKERESFPELRIIEGKPLPAGWLGKTSASQRLLEHGGGTYLLFIDADVRLMPGAISSSIAMMERESWDFISPYPRQEARSFLERLIQPLLQWSWFASVPLRIAARLRIPSMAVANGQFFLVKREALLSIGGFEAVKGEVLEDLEIARRLWRAGYHGSVVDGSEIAHCRMYDDGKELIDGYSKSLWRAFGSPWGAAVALTLLILTSWAPLIASLMGSPWGWFSYFAVSLSRLIAALRTRSFWQSFLLHPLSVAILIFMVIRSFHLKRKGALTWRDRSVLI